MPASHQLAIKRQDRFAHSLQIGSPCAEPSRCVEVFLGAGHRINITHRKVQISRAFFDLINHRMAGVDRRLFRSQEFSTASLPDDLIPAVPRQSFTKFVLRRSCGPHAPQFAEIGCQPSMLLFAKAQKPRSGSNRYPCPVRQSLFKRTLIGEEKPHLLLFCRCPGSLTFCRSRSAPHIP
jgi:hypothetical protein